MKTTVVKSSKAIGKVVGIRDGAHLSRELVKRGTTIQKELEKKGATVKTVATKYKVSTTTVYQAVAFSETSGKTHVHVAKIPTKDTETVHEAIQVRKKRKFGINDWDVFHNDLEKKKMPVASIARKYKISPVLVYKALNIANTPAKVQEHIKLGHIKATDVVDLIHEANTTIKNKYKNKEITKQKFGLEFDKTIIELVETATINHDKKESVLAQMGTSKVTIGGKLNLFLNTVDRMARKSKEIKLLKEFGETLLKDNSPDEILKFA